MWESVELLEHDPDLLAQFVQVGLGMMDDRPINRDLAALDRRMVVALDTSLDRGITRFLGRSGFENLGAGRPFGVFKIAMLIFDKSPAERDHHQDPQ